MSKRPVGIRGAWRWLVATAFRLLYHELAWSYDLVSWAASRGLWHRWQRVALEYLPSSGRMLEVGCGPGHVLVELAERGYQPAGVDASEFMVEIARRRLCRRGRDGIVCQAQAEALPFAPAMFDAVVATFPTAYIYDPGWIRHAMRVLKPGASLTIIDVATFSSTDPVSRSLEWLYQVTGQREPCPDLAELLQGAGFDAHRYSVEMQGSTVSVVVATKSKVPRCARANLTV